jgi:uncharacterized protein
MNALHSAHYFNVEHIFSDPMVAFLAQAGSRGDTNEIACLVDYGVDPNTHGYGEATPLLFSLLHGNAEGVRALLVAGADPYQEDSEGLSAVHLAAELDFGSKFLLIFSAFQFDLDRPSSTTGQSPLMRAAHAGNCCNVGILTNRGASLDRRDFEGETALHLAALFNRYDVILHLLRAGAPPLAVNAEGRDFKSYLGVGPDQLRMHRSYLTAQIEILQWLDKEACYVNAAVRQYLCAAPKYIVS